MATPPIAIRAEGLWKTYRIHPPDAPRRFGRRGAVDFHALSDVGFEVPEGAALGIVGHNGATEQTALSLAGPGEAIGSFPTGGIAVIDLEAPRWGSLVPGSGRLIHFLRPPKG